MATDSKYPGLKGLWFGLATTTLIGWLLFKTFGPYPEIVIGPDTTVIVAPLRADGLPDYEQYWKDRGSEGVTPENNGAVPFWQAMWPGELDTDDQTALSNALGMGQDLSPGISDPFSDDVTRSVGLWLMRQIQQDFSPEESGLTPQQLKRLYFQAGCECVISDAMERPWRSEECPPLAAWIHRHQELFDLLIEGSQRIKFWSPSPSALDHQHENTGFMKIPEIRSLRVAGRALSIRAMWHLGEGRSEAAWTDLLTCHRLARQLVRGTFIYEHQMVLAIDAVTSRTTTILLHHANLNENLARRILADLNSLEPLPNFALPLNRGSRICYADCAIGLATGRDELYEICSQQIGYPIEPAKWLRIDWNYVLREGNRNLDKLIKAVSLPSRRERLKALLEVENDLARLEQPLHNRQQLFTKAMSARGRDDLAVSHLVWAVLPTMEELCNDYDWSISALNQAKIAAALSVYRAKHGVYPPTLNELVPSILKTMPLDLYSERPFIFRLKPDGGYLLYGVYKNGMNDGGNDIRSEIVNGEWTSDESEFENDVFDLVIRVPVPKFEMPKKTELGESASGELE